MKKIILFFLSFLLLSSYSYSQSGWVKQHPNGPAIDPNTIYDCKYVSNTNIVCVGYKNIITSNDGGLNWNAPISIQTLSVNNTYRSVFFVNENVGFVGGYDKRIYKTINGGLSWTKQNNTSAQTNFYRLSFVNENTGFAAGGHFGIYKTVNSGVSWSAGQFLGKGIYGVSFWDENNGLAVGDTAFIIKTSNNGLSWEIVSTQYNKFLLDVDYFTSSTAIAVGHTGTVLKTQNGGLNWLQMLSGTLDTITDVDCINAATAYSVSYSGTTSKIWKTTDAGSSWTMLSQLNQQKLHSVSFLNENTGVSGGYTPIGKTAIFKTTNGGLNWFDAVPPPSTYMDLTDIEQIDENTIVAVGFDGAIIKTSNGALNWDYVGLTGTMSNFYGLGFANSTTGFATGQNGLLYRTTNAGSNWAHVNIGSGGYGQVSFANSNTGMILYNASVLKTTNGGASWNTMTGLENTLQDIQMIDENITYISGAITGGGGGGKIYKTTNGGTNWELFPLGVGVG